MLRGLSRTLRVRIFLIVGLVATISIVVVADRYRNHRSLWGLWKTKGSAEEVEALSRGHSYLEARSASTGDSGRLPDSGGKPE